MKGKKFEFFFVIGLAITLVIIVIVIGVISLSSNNAVPLPEGDFGPTPITLNEPPPIYNQQAQDKLMEKIENRKDLSEDDVTAKESILSVLPQGDESGILYQSANVIIDYIKGPDLFQVEILTTNTNQAKAEANAWFRRQGFSQYAICNHPVDFYLSLDVKEKFRGRNISFSPLAPNCK